MDRQLKKIVMVGSVICACVVAGLKWSDSKAKAAVLTRSPAIEASQQLAVVETASFSRNTFADVEAQREKALDDKRNSDELAKKQIKKTKSVECLFWTQQKLHSSAANIDEKIAQFCNL
jgi:hypothetical protein